MRPGFLLLVVLTVFIGSCGKSPVPTASDPAPTPAPQDAPKREGEFDLSHFKQAREQVQSYEDKAYDLSEALKEEAATPEARSSQVDQAERAGNEFLEKADAFVAKYKKHPYLTSDTDGPAKGDVLVVEMDGGISVFDSIKLVEQKKEKMKEHLAQFRKAE